MKHPFSIGIFDSGFGGLTVLKEVRRALPNVPLLYFGDTARVPYGTKSRNTVVRYSLQIVRFLLDKGVGMIIVACNTSSALSLPEIRAAVEVPVIDVVEPGAQKAVERTRNRKIGVIGTEATIQSGSYEHAIKKIDSSVEVFSQPCPMFVPLVEEGWVDERDPITLAVAQRYLSSFRDNGVDSLVLGCTHYPLLKPVIRKVLGPEIGLIDSAQGVAEKSATVVGSGSVRGYECDGKPSLECYVTDSVEKFKRLAPLFLGCESIDEVRHVDL